MPNQLNYPIPLGDPSLVQRPERITKVDHDLLLETNESIVFGTNKSDVVELWIYNPDGSFAGHTNLYYNDSALSLNTLVDVDRTIEVLNIDFHDVLRRIDILPGRYALTANIFRDEVGSEQGYKLYISNISDDRLTLTLTPVQVNTQVIKDMFEFLVPSVPRQIAKGLTDQAFGKAIKDDPASEIDAIKVGVELNNVMSDTIQRVNYANSQGAYLTMIQTILDRGYVQALNNMANEPENIEIQYVELEAYIEQALDDVIYMMQQMNEIDPRFELR